MSQLGEVGPNCGEHIFWGQVGMARQPTWDTRTTEALVSSCPEIWVIPLGIHVRIARGSDLFGPVGAGGHAGCQRRRESLRRYRIFLHLDGQYGEEASAAPRDDVPWSACVIPLILRHLSLPSLPPGSARRQTVFETGLLLSKI